MHLTGDLLPPAGHFMQRGDPGQGPHSQVCGCHKVEIQGETEWVLLNTRFLDSLLILTCCACLLFADIAVDQLSL